MSKRRRRAAVGKRMSLRETVTVPVSEGDESTPQGGTRPTQTVAARGLDRQEPPRLIRVRNDG